MIGGTSAVKRSEQQYRSVAFAQEWEEIHLLSSKPTLTKESQSLKKIGIVGEFLLDKSLLIRKYEKTLRTGGGFKQCFNDVLGFRLRFDDYPEEYPGYFRVVDLRKGKKIDDGYRAVHLYYQRDNLAYPIEVQLWCGKDFYFNIWSHQYVYKYKTSEIGKLLYQEYSAGMIRTEQEFFARLQELEAV